MRYRATVAYDGTAYKGFQRQANTPHTVQAVLETALSRIGFESTRIIGAGRTDAGVHAAGQVIAFDADWLHPTSAMENALSANLPDDVVISNLREADERFHPRYDALSRKYVYRIYIADKPDPMRRLYAWHHAQPLDVHSMRPAASILIGLHDFASFGSPTVGSSTIRNVREANWEESGDELCFTIRANAFLYKMVRSIVGTLAEVGRGKMTVTDFEGILAACNRSLAAPSAPPQGLTLVEVRYADD